MTKGLSGITNILTGGAGSAANKGGQVLSGASDWLKSIYDTTASQEKPFIESGTAANKTIMDVLTGGDTSSMDAFFNSSVFQFPLQQGLQQISNSNAAKGLSNSTAALRNASEFTTGLASQNFQSFLDNLFNLSTSGQQGISTQANAGAGVSDAFKGISTGLADAKGAAAAAPWQALLNAGKLAAQAYGGGGI